jgi:MoxR-like ATPase
MTDTAHLIETVTLGQAHTLIRAMAHEQSFLLLSPPGVGKSDVVYQTAAEAGLPCRSLLGTQIAPEDVSGIPYIVGERSVFCPPRVLLPEKPEPFCLFLDELPACTPDIQKAFYSLLLERRLGEHPLPKGTWVVAAGNRVEDRSLVRALSSALINRVVILHIRVDLQEWLAWAERTGIRRDVMAFLQSCPEALLRRVPSQPEPFSTPRAWAALSEALDLAEKADVLTPDVRRALAFGRVSSQDAAAFCARSPAGAGLSRRPNGIQSNDPARPGAAPTVTLDQVKKLLKAMAHKQSLLLLAPPGVGKSETVAQAAAEAGLPCRSLLGTQIAPEDVSGIPRIVGERAVFCPPRVLLPEHPEPFCLFLDELPACAADVQKAFYSLLLERRLGEHQLPEGTWVVAAGNRQEDRALVRTLSSALINRVLILHVRVDVNEWLRWGEMHSIRKEIVAFVSSMPETLMRPVPNEPVSFSTPRAWAALSHALDLAEERRVLDASVRRALAFGRLSAKDASVFCAMAEERIDQMKPFHYYVENPDALPPEETARWFILARIRSLVQRRELRAPAKTVKRFLKALTPEHRCAVLLDLVPEWGDLGAGPVMKDLLKELTGL